MARPIIIAGNWKMNTSLEGALALGRDIEAGWKTRDGRQVWVFPPAPFALPVKDALGAGAVRVGVQNVHVGPAGEQSGAFTGEWSPEMVHSAGLGLTLIGHSERRHVFGEGDDLMDRKVRGAIDAGLHVCYCVGETLAQRQAGQTEAVVGAQLESGLAQVTRDELQASVTIAYEPVWAIGTGQVASPEQAQEAHAHIRGVLDELYGVGASAEIAVLYGGSVKPDNVRGLMAMSDIDGALVGGASLKPASFLSLIEYDA